MDGPTDPDLIPVQIEEEQEQESPYQAAIFKAWTELAQLREEEKALVVKKARLKQTIDALWPLAFPDQELPDINSMTLADAIRLMVQSCNERPITVKEVRGKLQDIGFDLSKYKNPLASIHTAATRMVDSGELNWVDDDGNKLVAGEKMKPILTSQPDPAELLGAMGENSAGEK